MLITLGNHKLSKRIGVISLSAGRMGTCNQDCAGCFALKTEKLREAVKAKREMVTCLAKTAMFGRWVIDEIRRLEKKMIAVRVHEGGDFFSDAYVSTWVLIAKEFPKMKFYAYTKRIDDFDMAELAAQPNFILIDSLKPRNGKPNFADRKTLEAEGGHFICPWSKGMKCGAKCTYCLTKKAQAKPQVFVRR